MSALEEFRQGMNAYRRSADDEARSLKDPARVIEKLRDFYERLSPDERELADHVLAEWVFADDEATRYDAVALIDELQLVAALPALHKLAMRLSSAREPSARFELKKVDRIVNRLRG